MLPPAVGLWLGDVQPMPIAYRDRLWDGKLLFSIVSPHLEIVILSEGRAKRKPESKDLVIKESPFMIMVWRGRRRSFGAASGLAQDDSARRLQR